MNLIIAKIMRNRGFNILRKPSFLIIIILLFALSCEKKKYCVYRRFDLQTEYILVHSTKKLIGFSPEYNFSDPYKVVFTEDTKKRLDSLQIIEGYTIDSFLSKGITGYAYRIDGDCQYCNYYKSLLEHNACELHEY